MKVFILLSIFFVILHSSNQSYSPRGGKLVQPANFKLKAEKVKAEKAPAQLGDTDLCSTCLQFSQEAITELLGIALRTVVDSCTELCIILAKEVGNIHVAVACELLCGYVGIGEFMDMVKKADLDAIYYCELIYACEIKDDGDATITNFTVTPKTLPRGGPFEISMTYRTANGTGTSSIILYLRTQDGLPAEQLLLLEPQDPGKYTLTWEGKAQPDPDCVEIKYCEQWLPGNYTAGVEICNGQCGSKHPHTQLYDKKTYPFNIVDNHH